MSEKASNYLQGYSKAVVQSHASRTVDSDAAFLRPHIKPTDRILDVGCGPGTITAGLSALVPRGSVTAVDISDEILRQAEANIAEARRAGSLPAESGPVTFQTVDLLAGLPFADGAFDVVFSSQLFPHLPPPDAPIRGLREMRRVLRPGGVVATRDGADIHFYPRAKGLDALWAGNMAKALGRGAAGAGLPGGGMPALYRQAGFDVDGGKVSVGAGTTVYASKEARQWFAQGCVGRLTGNDAYRESWLKAGISEAEIEETKAAMLRWADADDAWYVCLQAEILAWK